MRDISPDGPPIAVIADIVGSRSLPDRAGAQSAIEHTFAVAARDLPVAVAPFHATVGDEFQAVYASLGDALRSILLLQLGLPAGIGLRFGLGVGDIRPLASTAAGLSDGPGWWAARAAIDEVHRMQRRAVPAARTWIVGGADQDGHMIALANAYALARDELVAAMGDRTRRLVRGRCVGRTQRELADAEGVTQSAVSQALGVAGARTVVAGFAVLGPAVTGADAATPLLTGSAPALTSALTSPAVTSAETGAALAAAVTNPASVPAVVDPAPAPSEPAAALTPDVPGPAPAAPAPDRASEPAATDPTTPARAPA